MQLLWHKHCTFAAHVHGVGAGSWAHNWGFAPKTSTASATSGNVNMFGTLTCTMMHYSLCQVHTACWPHGTLPAKQPYSHPGWILDPSSCFSGCDIVTAWCAQAANVIQVHPGYFMPASITSLPWPHGLCGMLECAQLALCMCHD